MLITPEIKGWLERAKLGVEANSKANWPKCDLNWDTLDWTEGKKYIRVIRAAIKDGSGASAYCFLDIEGNIYFCDGWKRPAKGVRGTIHSVDPEKLDGSTRWMYRKPGRSYQ